MWQMAGRGYDIVSQLMAYVILFEYEVNAGSLSLLPTFYLNLVYSFYFLLISFDSHICM